MNLTAFARKMNIFPVSTAELIPPLTCTGKQSGSIAEGSRNSTLSKKAGQLLKKYGDTDKARKAFDEWAAKCQPPLDVSELDVIYKSAQGFLHKSVKLQANYIAPDDYAAQSNWQSMLLYNDKGKLTPSTRNLELIFTNDKRINAFAFNELTGHIEKTGSLPWAARGTAWSDCDDVQLKSWLVHHYAAWSESVYNNTLLKIADDRVFHPIRDYFTSLPPWDYSPRLDRLYVLMLCSPDTPYVRAVTRKSHVAAITRVFAPGTKFDNMVVLVGPQGIGKSTLLSKLGGKWYTDGLKISDMQDPKRAAEKLQGSFIIEIGELAGLKKVEVETVKGFISCQSDNFREAYAKRAVPHPRQCVFFGTTNNEDGFLRDVTGNRRYWVVDTPGGGAMKPWDMTDDYINQVWAEAYHYYRQGESLILPPELNEAAEQAQRAAMEPDDRAGIVRVFLELRLPPKEEWDQLDGWRRYEYCKDSENPTRKRGRSRDFVSNIEIWVECFGKRKEDIQPKDSYAIAGIMKRFSDWQKADKPVRLSGYGLQRGYKRVSCNVVVSEAVNPVKPL